MAADCRWNSPQCLVCTGSEKERKGRLMKKILAFLALAIVIALVAYTSIDWQSDTDNAAQANQNVPLKSGGTIQLTAEENALTAGPGEKKIVLTDLGMY
jgi:ferric-dicitrate binding protein FerR (iron transport regulator)